MSNHFWLPYTIWLANKAQLNALLVGNPTGSWYASPDAAAATYGAPILSGSAPFAAPCITSPWIGSTDNFPTDQRDFTRCHGGWFGLCGLFSTSADYSWSGTFKLAPNTTEAPLPDDVPTPFAQRKWIDGFELYNVESSSDAGNASTKLARRASRHLQGYGLSIDNHAVQRIHIPDGHGAALGKTEWDRMYVRIMRYPTEPSKLWTVVQNAGAACGIMIHVHADGKLGIYDVDGAGTQTLKATSAQALTINTWFKLDILTKSSVGAFFQLFINGALETTLLAAALPGMSAAGGGGGFIVQSIIGGGKANGSGVGVGLTIHYDDWIGAEWPTEGFRPGVVGPNFKTAPGFDWNNGSRVAFVGANGLGATNDGNWAGDWRLTRQRLAPGAAPQNNTSSTTLARLAVTTDAAIEVNGQVGGIGVAAFIVHLYSQRGAASGTLGWRYGGVDTLAAIVQQSSSLFWNQVMYRPSGLILPLTPFSDFELVHVKGAGADLSNVQNLACSAEILGVFNPEDVVTQTTDILLGPPVQQPAIGIHNAPYPHSQWARKGPAPLGPVVIHSGTYVGNGTFQDLVFRAPVHMLIVRNVTGGGSWLWFSSANGGHDTLSTVPEPFVVIEAVQVVNVPPPAVQDDQEQRTLVRLAGNNVSVNIAASTYQYTAFCDPAVRFVNCGALAVSNGAADFVSHLDADAFTPEAVFLLQELDGLTGTDGFWYKGIGHAASAASKTDAAETASALSVSNGTMTSKAGIHGTALQQIAYAAFRRNDGSGDPNINSVLQLASYTGDGSASRTVGLGPPSLKRPVWAMVVPHNAQAVMRDASHTGTTSTGLPNTSLATTGITGGGIDSISVGSVLNANGIVYDVFVLVGSATAGNGGFSPPGEFIVIDPVGVPGGPGTPFDPTPTFPTVTVPVVDPSDPINPIDYTTLTCLNASTVIVNAALSMLGVGKRVVDLLLDATQEASTARLHYGDNINAVLRDFPWPFATRYAPLVLVGGTPTVPVNGDWQYSYRTPIDCIFARRVVNPDGVKRAYDPDPVKFRTGSDDVGNLIYCDQDSTVDPVELEYTVRSTCAATDGDALFRTALVWRLAHLMAPTLCRDEKKVIGAWQMYVGTLQTARRVASSEVQQDQDGDADWITGRG